MTRNTHNNPVTASLLHTTTKTPSQLHAGAAVRGAKADRGELVTQTAQTLLCARHVRAPPNSNSEYPRGHPRLWSATWHVAGV